MDNQRDSTLESLLILNELQKDASHNRNVIDRALPYTYIILNEVKSELSTQKLHEIIKTKYNPSTQKHQLEPILVELDSKNYIQYNKGKNSIQLLIDGEKYVNNIKVNSKINSNTLNILTTSFYKYLSSADSKIQNIESINTDEVMKMIVSFIDSNSLYAIKNISSDSLTEQSMAALYILWAKLKDTDAYQIICDIGSAKTFLAIWDMPTNEILTLRNTKFYIDTPFLLSLSGCHDEYAEEIAKLIVKFIISKSGKMFIFGRIYLELENIIESAIRTYNIIEFDYKKASRLAIFFRNNRASKFKNEDLVILWKNNFIRKLHTEYKIEVDQNDYYHLLSNNAYQIDESMLRTYFSQHRNNDSVYIEDSIDNDIYSLSTICRIRQDDGNKKYNDWQSTPAVLLTLNTMLYDALKEVRLGGINHRIPAVINNMRMLHIISNNNYQKFTSLYSCELLSFASYIQEKSQIEVMTIIDNKNLRDEYHEHDKADLELLCLHRKLELSISKSLETNPNIINNNNFTRDYEILNSNLKAEEEKIKIEEELKNKKQEHEDYKNNKIAEVAQLTNQHDREVDGKDQEINELKKMLNKKDEDQQFQNGFEQFKKQLWVTRVKHGITILVSLFLALLLGALFPSYIESFFKIKNDTILSNIILFILITLLSQFFPFLRGKCSQMKMLFTFKEEKLKELYTKTKEKVNS